jgi:flagellar basal-body rod protein FlgB
VACRSFRIQQIDSTVLSLESRPGSGGLVSKISDASVVDALRRQMTISVAKQVASSGNLANVDTPGYKTKEVTFTDALKSKLAPVNATYPSARPKAAAPAILPARRDGNNVSLDREMLAMSRAAGDFAAAQTALAAKFRLVRYAINEGK